MTGLHFAGWDIGGAHLKYALVDTEGRVVDIRQYPTPIWQDREALSSCLKRLKIALAGSQVMHAVTMTAELVDTFQNREDGVIQILDIFSSVFCEDYTLVYAGGHGLIELGQVRDRCRDIASANWHATASYLAMSVQNTLLLDIGSTTTDLVLVLDGKIANRGYTDHERMLEQELLYTGMVRTPVMAVVKQVPFRNTWQGVAAEYFAAMADIYRITGALNEADDLMPAADGGAKSRSGSLQRLAHMLGGDLEDELLEDDLVEVAEHIASQQLLDIEKAVLHKLDCGVGRRISHVTGAGIGRGLAEKLASRQCLDYLDISSTLDQQESRPEAGNCAPALSIAQMARIKP